MDKNWPYPFTQHDWLWYRPDSDDKYMNDSPGDGFYFRVYHHGPCAVTWAEIVSDSDKGKPRCFNCGKWVKRR